MEEIWKPVVGYEGLYEVSSLGRVKSLQYRNKYISKKRELVLKSTRYYYYSCVDLRKNNIRKVKRIHRLVAEAFIPNPYNLPAVMHLDESVDINGLANNSICNLKWGTNSDNQNDKYSKGRDNNPMRKGIFIHKRGAESPNAKKVLQYNIDGSFVKEWQCVEEIANYFEISRHSVYSATACRSKTCKGFIWKYL